MSNLNLGIIYKDNEICNHRSLLKILTNPFLRSIGFVIATRYDEKTERLGGLMIQRIKKESFQWSFNYPIEYNMRVVKKRVFI